MVGSSRVAFCHSNSFAHLTTGGLEPLNPYIEWFSSGRSSSDEEASAPIAQYSEMPFPIALDLDAIEHGLAGASGFPDDDKASIFMAAQSKVPLSTALDFEASK